MKTIEKAGKEYAYMVCDTKGKWDSQARDGFEEGVKFAESWTPVEEESPTNQDILLVKSDGDCVCIAYFHGEASGFITYGDDAYNEFGEITHWRPISHR